MPNEVARQLLADSIYAQVPAYGPCTLTPAASETRWQLMLTIASDETNLRRFDYERLLRTAQNRRSRAGPPTVSHFTDWVYTLYGVRRERESLHRGHMGESVVGKHRLPSNAPSDWELVHNGMGEDACESPFRISALRVRGLPLRGSPDLVFRQRPSAGKAATGHERIVIVEIKCSSAPMPPDLWPNIRAQLWAYSKIDAFAEAEEIFLVGEVWRIDRRSCSLRRSITWRRNEKLLEEECGALFQAYLGA